MRRGLRVALAGTIAAGAVLCGAGTAYADSDGGGDDDDHGHHDKRAGCSSKMDKDTTLREDQLPSDNAPAAFKNTTKKDARDAHGNPYYLHNDVCQTNDDPWRGRDWDDDSYKTFHFERDKNGRPSRDKKKNTYVDSDGHNKSYRKDRKDLEPDHIGAPLHPANQPQ